MKQFLILIAVALVGCVESEKAVQESEKAVQETEDVFVQIRKALIIDEQEGDRASKVKSSN